MDGEFFRGNKHTSLSLEKPEDLMMVAKALSSMERISMIRLLNDGPKSVNELAERLSLPVSTAALHVKKLEQAGITNTEVQPGTRGAVKLSTRKVDSISITLTPEAHYDTAVQTINISIGAYSLLGGIVPTCGLTSEHNMIGIEDQISSFYLPEHISSQLLWFRAGYIEYHVAAMRLDEINVKWLELSFEACSEAPMYRDPWKSDIHVSLNDQLLGVWTSPCDCGNRRGKLNPSWWPNSSTQFGFLKSFRVDETGTLLDGVPISSTTIDQLRLYDKPYMAIRFTVPIDAVNAGGINLFGEAFGDYPQGIVLRIGYTFR